VSRSNAGAPFCSRSTDAEEPQNPPAEEKQWTSPRRQIQLPLNIRLAHEDGSRALFLGKVLHLAYFFKIRILSPYHGFIFLRCCKNDTVRHWKLMLLA